MSDLTGVMTSTGEPLGPGLQHNPAARQEMSRRHGLRELAHDEAMHAALSVSVAEQAIETLQIRIRAAERAQASWSAAAAAMPETMGAEDPDAGALDRLRADLAQAEQYLATATRTHAAASERFRVAHNDAEAFKRSVYADYRDAVEVEAL